MFALCISCNHTMSIDPGQILGMSIHMPSRIGITFRGLQPINIRDQILNNTCLYVHMCVCMYVCENTISPKSGTTHTLHYFGSDDTVNYEYIFTNSIIFPRCIPSDTYTANHC